MELHRAVAGKYHHIVCRYLGHSAGNLCIGGKRLIADNGRAVVNKGSRVFHADINVHRRVFECLIRPDQLAKLLPRFQILGNASQTLTRRDLWFLRPSAAHPATRCPSVHSHRFTTQHLCWHDTGKVDIRSALGQINQHIVRDRAIAMAVRSTSASTGMPASLATTTKLSATPASATKCLLPTSLAGGIKRHTHIGSTPVGMVKKCHGSHRATAEAAQPLRRRLARRAPDKLPRERGAQQGRTQ